MDQDNIRVEEHSYTVTESEYSPEEEAKKNALISDLNARLDAVNRYLQEIKDLRQRMIFLFGVSPRALAAQGACEEASKNLDKAHWDLIMAIGHAHDISTSVEVQKTVTETITYRGDEVISRTRTVR